MRVAAFAVGVAALAITASPAMAVRYPPAKDPPGVQKAPKGPHHTLKVGKHAKYKTIIAAVKHAKAGDTIRVAHGTYKGQVHIAGAKKRYLQIIGDVKHPNKVIVELKGRHGPSAQNGFFIDGADQVRVAGFQAQHYKANGFFALNVKGYKFDHDIGKWGGTYGLYAFNSYGGVMTDDVGAWNNDSGFYIGQTPKQTKPTRTIATRLKAYGNVIGWSGTNMRYVTITKSKFWNNGTGIVPNTLDSEKFPPPERNVIVDNDIFWNNFNFHEGHPPFKVNDHATSALVPIGTGIVFLGGRQNRVENNRIFGNYLGGIGAIDGFLLKENPQAVTLDRNIVKGNQFGRGGTDTNGRDIVYDGSGTGNCFTLAPTDTVLDPSALGTCSGGKNPFSQPTRDEMLSWIGEGATKGWRKPGHPPKKGYKPLESFK